MNRTQLNILIVFCALASGGLTQDNPAAEPAKFRPREIVLVSPAGLTPPALAAFKAEGFHGVAVVIDESNDRTALDGIARATASDGLELYFWVEVARNPRLADAHPRWMASLGSHDDWQKRYPNTRLPRDGEVAKAWPWVPITCREAFNAHIQRMEDMLQRMPSNTRGILLNDLQGGPASCGCGNLQCRWATDYHVAATATRIEGDDAAAKFVTEVQKRAAGKPIIPVWTTECEDADLPPDQREGKSSTGLCGSVGCATGLCPKEFARQWSALRLQHSGPVALLGLHREFGRAGEFYGNDAAWLTHAVSYLDRVPLARGGPVLPREQLWLVVEGGHSDEQNARRRAKDLGASTIIVARTHIDQSYLPRLIPAK